ncbi:hypothetical protein V8C34DRAFT_73328 [Trichoderma compactum]
MDRATLAWYSSVLVYRSSGQDNDSSPRYDACRWLRARGNWHLAMLAANRALRFPMSKVGSVSPAATALLCTALHCTAPPLLQGQRPEQGPRKGRNSPQAALDYSTAEFSKPLSRHTDVRLTPPVPNSQCTQSLLR